MIIEKIVLNYLKTELDVPVMVEQPTGQIGEYVVFQVTERGWENHIEAATIEFSSYGESKLDAAEVDEAVRNAMLDIVTLDEISASKFGGGRDDKDDELKRYRYRSYFNLFF